MDARDSGQRSAVSLWRAVFAAALLGALFLALRPASGETVSFPHVDKLGHAAAFAALAWLAWQAGIRQAGWLFGGLLLFGVGIEVAQSFTTTRQAEFADVVADAAGLAIGLAWLRPATPPHG